MNDPRTTTLAELLDYLDGRGIVVTEGNDFINIALDYFDLNLDTNLVWTPDA